MLQGVYIVIVVWAHLPAWAKPFERVLFIWLRAGAGRVVGGLKALSSLRTAYRCIRAYKASRAGVPYYLLYLLAFSFTRFVYLSSFSSFLIGSSIRIILFFIGLGGCSRASRPETNLVFSV